MCCVCETLHFISSLFLHLSWGCLRAEKVSQGWASSSRGTELGLGHARDEPKRKGQGTKEGRLYRRALPPYGETQKGQKKKMGEGKETQSFPEQKRAAWGSEGTSSLPPPKPRKTSHSTPASPGLKASSHFRSRIGHVLCFVWGTCRHAFLLDGSALGPLFLFEISFLTASCLRVWAATRTVPQRQWHPRLTLKTCFCVFNRLKNTHTHTHTHTHESQEEKKKALNSTTGDKDN